MLLKNGSKQAELDYMGWDEAFTGKSVTKAEIQEWIDGNKVEIEEVSKGGVERRDLSIRYEDNGTFSIIDANNNIIKRGLSQRAADDYIDSYWDGQGDTKHSQWQLPRRK